jgi:hypothetical protein
MQIVILAERKSEEFGQLTFRNANCILEVKAHQSVLARFRGN